ncbi:hypothetical protein I306_00506 [Cryptococcus gattii EJB2]|uniref:Uncharacterized protein n=1 Tax=Cryptococcus gattii EJB2 TaxID=1296103 RepID=A0ABR5C3A8_9TREE|nr:hypothetical protein I306_00506 [Cryptococcus gattii EJB2]
MLLLEEKMTETPRMTMRMTTGMQGRTSKGRRMIVNTGGLSEGARIVAAISNSIPARGRRADLTELHSTLMAMEDRGLNEKRQFHKEITELKAATLCLEREQFAEDKVRRDREEQALEEHRRMERRAKEEEMECRRKEVSAKAEEMECRWREVSAKEEEMECRRREVSAKEEESIHSSILRIAQFVLPCVSGDPVEAYKKAVTMYESQRRQGGEDNNS